MQKKGKKIKRTINLKKKSTSKNVKMFLLFHWFDFGHSGKLSNKTAIVFELSLFELSKFDCILL